MSEELAERKRAGRMRDWPKLRREFFEGDWLTVKSFMRDKGLPYQHRTQGKAKGWAEQKRKLREAATDKSIMNTYKKEAELVSPSEARLRQARLARFMQVKGEVALEELDIETADEARKMIDTGIRNERSALGMESGRSPNLTQVNIYPRTRFDDFIENASYEELLRFVGDIRRSQVRLSAPEGVVQDEGEVHGREATGLLDMGEHNMDDSQGGEAGLREEKVSN